MSEALCRCGALPVARLQNPVSTPRARTEIMTGGGGIVVASYWLDDFARAEHRTLAARTL